MSKPPFALAGLALAFGGAGAFSQPARPLGRVTVLTVDERRLPLAGVEIRAGARNATTDRDGRVILDSVPVGRVWFVARRVGYVADSIVVAVDAVRRDTLQFILGAAGVTIDRLDIREEPIVSARLEGFERRRQRNNSGQFVTRADLDRMMPQTTTDVIRRMRGVRLVDSMGVQLPVSTRGQKVDMTTRRIVLCVMRVGVDGILKEPYFPMNTVTTTDLYGIEVYPGAASLPPEFGGARKDAGCGLIMIWTRSR